MRHLAKLIALCAACVLPLCANAADQLSVTPSGMRRCETDSSCVRLMIKNHGDSPVAFGVNGALHPTIPEPRVRYFLREDGSWLEFGQIVGTFMAPRRTITIRPGQVRSLYVVISDVPKGLAGKTLRVSVQDGSGTFHDSVPFNDSGIAQEQPE